MAGHPDCVLRRLTGLCPICLGTAGDGLTAGLPDAAIVLLAGVAIALVAVARLAWRLWRYEAS